MEQKTDSWDFDKGTKAIDGKRTDFSNSDPLEPIDSHMQNQRHKNTSI